MHSFLGLYSIVAAFSLLILMCGCETDADLRREITELRSENATNKTWVCCALVVAGTAIIWALCAQLRYGMLFSDFEKAQAKNAELTASRRTEAPAKLPAPVASSDSDELDLLGLESMPDLSDEIDLLKPVPVLTPPRIYISVAQNKASAQRKLERNS